MRDYILINGLLMDKERDKSHQSAISFCADI